MISKTFQKITGDFKRFEMISTHFNDDWWLRTIFLLRRHVEIVDKDDASEAWWRAVDPLSALSKFTVDDVLRLICTGLC